MFYPPCRTGGRCRPPERCTRQQFRAVIEAHGKTATGIEVPAEVVEALAAVPAARAFLDGVSSSQRRWFVLGIEEAKKPETRVRRIDKAVARPAEGRGQT